MCRSWSRVVTASLSFLHDAAREIRFIHKPVHIYYFGDYDPSGLDISKQVEARLRQYAPNADIHFVRVAVNPEQITALNLPTRPTKKTDSRSKAFKGESVEVDAIEPNLLREMAREVIQQHIDPKALAQTRIVEESERSALDMFIRDWSKSSDFETRKRQNCQLQEDDKSQEDWEEDSGDDW